MNDTFTALTCVDWLGDALCKLTARWNPHHIYRDRQRVHPCHQRRDELSTPGRAGVRQDPPSATGMPAVMIRQLDALAKVMVYTTTDDQRAWSERRPT